MFLFAFSRIVFSEMPRILELVVCWQLVGRISAVKGVKYARVFIVNIFSVWFQSIQGVIKLAKEKQQCMVSSEYFVQYLIEMNVISD